jgi:hypothetical protein
MKPHEETWTFDATASALRTSGDPELGPGRAFAIASSDVDAARLRLAAAAPKLARALLTLERVVRIDGCPVCRPSNKWGHTPGCPVAQALNEAGVR